MDPNRSNKRINQGASAPSGYGSQGNVSGQSLSCFGSAFTADGNGISLELLALLLTGDRAAGSLLAPLNRNVHVSAQLPPRTTVIIPNGINVPSWDDTHQFDPFERSYLNYWTARALEAHFNAPGAVLGVTAVVACDLGKDGKPGQCCDPTADPFPSKPYFYKVPVPPDGQPVKRPEEVVRDFGRDENGWIELRRANADDEAGFAKDEKGWCWWKDWGPGKRLRVPGSWQEERFTPDVFPNLVDGNGNQFRMQDLAGYANFFMKGMCWRWGTPVHMMVECGKPLWCNPSIRPGLDVDPLIAKEMIKRTFLAK